MILMFLTNLLLISITPADAESTWKKLIAEKKFQEADTECNGWTKSDNKLVAAEGHKCLANATIGKGASGGGVVIEGNDAGGGILKAGDQPKTILAAIEHLNRAIALSPKDESIHQGRLHLALRGSLYDKIDDYLKNSLATYGKRDLDLWLPYSGELYELGQHKAAIAFMKVLEANFPNDHRIYANMGAFYSMLKKDNEASKYLETAVKMNPKDPINLWNLGRHLEFTGKNMEALANYKKSLSFETNKDEIAMKECLVGKFMVEKLNKIEEGCRYQTNSCSDEISAGCIQKKKSK